MQGERATGADNFGVGPLDASGIMRWTVMARLLTDRSLLHGAEIGVADGVFTRELIARVPHSTVMAVDPWRRCGTWKSWDTDWQHEQVVALATANPGRVIVTRSTSAAAASWVEDHSLDWVFIDGDHRYEAVAEDIRLWTPKVRAGGIVAGHDRLMDGVARALAASGPFNAEPDQVWWREQA